MATTIAEPEGHTAVFDVNFDDETISLNRGIGPSWYDNGSFIYDVDSTTLVKTFAIPRETTPAEYGTIGISGDNMVFFGNSYGIMAHYYDGRNQPYATLTQYGWVDPAVGAGLTVNASKTPTKIISETLNSDDV